MKNFFKLLGIIALVAVIGFSMVACGEDPGGGDGGGGGGGEVTFGDFTLYIKTDGSIYILKYIGRGGVVNIPSQYKGKPISAIGGAAFLNCANVTSVTIPNSVTMIHGATSTGAFGNCTGLTSITIPASVTSIGDRAFRGCTKLISVTFQGTINEDNFGTTLTFPGDLRAKYLAGGPGTYTRESGSSVWAKL